MTDRLSDIVEIEQLLARFAVSMTKHDIDTVVSEVFAPDGSYRAFGEVYELHDFPALAKAAPRGLFLTGTPSITFEGDDVATGEQPLLFVGQTDHHHRLGWYTDRYVRIDGRWRLHTRSMTFLRKSGAVDSGRPHDPLRPEPTAKQ